MTIACIVYCIVSCYHNALSSMCGERHGIVEVDNAGSMECLSHGLSIKIWTIISVTGHFIFVTCVE